MVENAQRPIRIDLNEFKLHIDLRKKISLTLHFNSPSRRFYLSLIAFVVNEMTKRGKITSIPLEEYLDLLALLNESIGGSAGSSDKGNLLPRIYRKWQHALPNLEEAPLFNVLGKKKKYDEVNGKTYPFTEAEKDNWANLFEYKGSEENVRLKFAIDKIGASLNDVVIVYEDSLNAEAWERFISSLKEKEEEKPKAEPISHISEEPEATAPQLEKRKISRPSWYRWGGLIAAIIVVLGAITLAIWKAYLKPAPIQVASIEKMAFPLPDKPSIAVLPFENMSNDPKQEFFSDGMTEEIITALSKSPYLFVIARNSTFTYKGKPVKVKQVAEELGVRYVLEGSVRRSGEKVRIAAQLVDAIKGHHIWAERYDRDLKDLFAIEDDITKKIITALQVMLTQGEQAILRGKGTENLDAYLKCMEASEYVLRMNKDANLMARQRAEEAIALDPKYSSPHAILGKTHIMDVFFNWSASPRESIVRAFESAKKALSLDDSDFQARLVLTWIYLLKREHDKAIEECEGAVSLAPNAADAVFALGIVLRFAGRVKDAVPMFERAIRLNPIPQAAYLSQLASSYTFIGEFEKAISICKKALLKNPDDLIGRIALVVAYTSLGRESDARAEVAEVLRIDPKFSLDYAAKTWPYKRDADRDFVLTALRKAGLK